ncbi:UDP-N-acetylhexosamine pyrophosphorylase-like isoform X2 [Diorhabda carinulata]|uniref:UDP-N-acetylhexosamine pyrophosphorylase-like isoform X2 n=1 Tax=Diorhabda carinulata TaxID=1163345 RepID=UPI0025A0953A|nr:UDP-N-acetylhexosamine pyrophosphorylase-like isoform X2 [Diorhabda carinulata]
MSLNEIEDTLFAYNQQHLIQYWKELTEEDQLSLITQLKNINFNNVSNLFQKAQTYIQEGIQKLDDHMKPVPRNKFEAELKLDTKVLEEYFLLGLKEISKGHVGVILLAGGQGSRLGVTYPKGMFPLELPSGKTLFQIQAERIRRIQKLAEERTGKYGKICWFIMTSEENHEPTENYFNKHGYFGLNKEDVILFRQGLLPCFTFDGKIILEDKNRIALAPDGNGGIYKALQKNHIVEHMKKRNIKYVHVHSVDNILVKVADPSFIGYCVKKGADCGAKVIPKENPHDALGVVCEVNGKFQVVEYSEITDKTANLRNEEGELVFSAGSICNHFFTSDFLEKASTVYEKELKPHVAKKKIPYIDESGNRIQPKTPNGVKIEKFIFDVFEYSQNFVTWEVPRNAEFSPLKNCESVHKDCPSTCKRDLLLLHKSYIQKAGGIVKCEELEISPLLSYAGENLESKVKGKVFDKCTVILSDEEVVVNGFKGTI